MAEILKLYKKNGYSIDDEISDKVKNLSDEGYEYLKENMVQLELYEDVVDFDKVRN